MAGGQNRLKGIVILACLYNEFPSKKLPPVRIELRRSTKTPDFLLLDGFFELVSKVDYIELNICKGYKVNI